MPVSASGNTNIALRCYICMFREEMVIPANILNKQSAAVDMAKARGWYFTMDGNAGAWCCPQCEDKKRYLKVRPGDIRKAEQTLQGTGAQPPAASQMAVCKACECSVPNGDAAFRAGWVRYSGGDDDYVSSYWKCKSCIDTKYVPSRPAESHLIPCLECGIKVARTYATETGWVKSWRGNTEIFRCRICHERHVKIMAPVPPTSISASMGRGDPQYRPSHYYGPTDEDVARCVDCDDWRMKHYASKGGWVWSSAGTGTVCRCPKCYKAFKDKKPNQVATNADYRPSMEVKTGVTYLAARSRYAKKPEEVKA